MLWSPPMPRLDVPAHPTAVTSAGWSPPTQKSAVSTRVVGTSHDWEQDAMGDGSPSPLDVCQHRLGADVIGDRRTLRHRRLVRIPRPTGVICRDEGLTGRGRLG